MATEFEDKLDEANETIQSLREQLKETSLQQQQVSLSLQLCSSSKVLQVCYGALHMSGHIWAGAYLYSSIDRRIRSVLISACPPRPH